MRACNGDPVQFVKVDSGFLDGVGCLQAECLEKCLSSGRSQTSESAVKRKSESGGGTGSLELAEVECG